ncbi:CPBP family intramembrane metalloprotease [Pseudomonas sp. WS 5503]|nr:type II CAAX endopeptidase family protein [Pseudomonas mucoides]MBF6043395.1 CPBP family intramembrane metalloprotease [Pseudomonas mucoides]NMX83639.1 CPBP family intramembrane metalloprotease [Pseudomonas sp. WS 5503]NNB23653.1 CPBP family intramembrane metalloprotease [Pseudomonas fragi]
MINAISPGYPPIDQARYSWWRRCLIGITALFLALAIQTWIFTVVGKEEWNSLWLMLAHGATAVALLFLAAVQLRDSGGLRALLGHGLGRTLKVYLPIVIVIYVVCTSLDVGLGYGRETFMISFLGGLSALEKLLCLVMLLALPPISEELLYRHFLMRLFPMNSRFWQWTAILITSTLFMLMHSQYAHWPSFALIGSLAVLFAYARVRTGGILVPVLLHSFAEICGMLSDTVLSQLV